MVNKKVLFMAVLAVFVLVLFGCGKAKQETNGNNNANTSIVGGEAPYVMSGSTKVFALKLVNGRLNYTTMTFYAGDSIRVELTSDGQLVDFEFIGVGAQSTNGAFSTMISNTDPGGTYQLGCQDRACGSLTVTVINSNKNINTAQDTNSSFGISKAELQRLPAGADFSRYVSGELTMEVTNRFKISDQYGLNVTGTFQSGDMLTHAISDNTGKEVFGQGPQSKLQTGSNGTCCFSLPEVAGEYNVNLYVNGNMAESMTIIVSEE